MHSLPRRDRVWVCMVFTDFHRLLVLLLVFCLPLCRVVKGVDIWWWWHILGLRGSVGRSVLVGGGRLWRPVLSCISYSLIKWLQNKLVIFIRGNDLFEHQCLWNNRDLTCIGKVLFLGQWIAADVEDIWAEGNILVFDQICEKVGHGPWRMLEYNTLHTALRARPWQSHWYFRRCWSGGNVASSTYLCVMHACHTYVFDAGPSERYSCWTQGRNIFWKIFCSTLIYQVHII